MSAVTERTLDFVLDQAVAIAGFVSITPLGCAHKNIWICHRLTAPLPLTANPRKVSTHSLSVRDSQDSINSIDSATISGFGFKFLKLPQRLAGPGIGTDIPVRGAIH